ncbi:MAG: EamA family transporter [Opitutaceae bacterium]|nr:EamA family transporter [Opitutaceae bacterium]
MNWLFWSLLAALFAGLTAIFAKLGLANIGSNLATAIRTSVVLILVWAIAAATREVVAIGTITKRNWVFLILSGLATGLSWLCYFRALQLGEASRVAPIDKLSVVFVLVFAGLFLHEPITWRSACGAGLIVGGGLLLALK